MLDQPGERLPPRGDWEAFLRRGKRVVGELELASRLATSDLVVTSALHDGRSRFTCHSMLDEHPSLQVVCVTPFGQTGPYRDRVADDVVLSAMVGLSDATPGFPDHCEGATDPPVQSLAPLAESGAGIVAAVAVVGALLGAERGAGRIRHVELSMHEIATALMVMEWGTTAYGGGVKGRRPVPPELAPNCYLPCADGEVVLVGYTDPHWRALVEMLGSPEWANDPRFTTGADRARNWDELQERLANWALAQRGADVLEAAQARGAPSCCFFELRDTVSTEHLRATGALDGEFPGDPIVVDGRRGWRTIGDSKPGRQRSTNATSSPLAGIRVIDLGQIVAAPFAGQLLAALGAEVILVESRTHLTSRLFGPFVGEPKHDAGMMFHQVNRGKQSVEIDLTSPAGRASLLELVDDADVVIENFSRRTARRLGLTHEELSRVKPDLVLGSITGFGSSGPWRDYVALHSGAILMSGLASVTRDDSGRPRLAGAIYPDLLAGSYLALGIEQALCVRERTRRGSHVEVSMLDVLLSCMAGLVPEAVSGGTFEPHPSRFLPTHEKGRYLAAPPEVSAADAAARTRAEATQRLQTAGVAAAGVLDLQEVLEDDHLRSTGFIQEIGHPVAGIRPFPGVPWRYDDVRPPLGAAPTLGNATRRLLGVEPEAPGREGAVA
jgi:crotonobetainyl-CoA:carnitine CoA-transferase CaiB-like acyl-CoA transferase